MLSWSLCLFKSLDFYSSYLYHILEPSLVPCFCTHEMHEEIVSNLYIREVVLLFNTIHQIAYAKKSLLELLLLSFLCVMKMIAVARGFSFIFKVFPIFGSCCLRVGCLYCSVVVGDASSTKIIGER